MTESVQREPSGVSARGGWWERLHSAAIAISAKPAFRAWAARFPFTRPVARRRARKLFDLCAGFVYSQVLLACVRLRVFEILHDAPLTLTQVAARLSLTKDATARLVDSAVTLRLLRCDRQSRYTLGPLGAALIGNDALRAMIEHNALLYADLSDPVATLRAGGAHGELARYWPYNALRESHDDDAAAGYSELMSRSQPLVAQEILDAYSLKPHRCLLDVGGGNGEFLRAAAAKASHLSLQLFDLPAVAALARNRLAPLIEKGRAHVFDGSFFDDALPRGADIATLVRVLHDHDDAHVARLLSAVRQALPQGGRILVAEPMAATSGAETVGVYFDFYLFAMGKGRPRTQSETQDLLKAAGFTNPRRLSTHVPLQTCVLIADVA